MLQAGVLQVGVLRIEVLQLRLALLLHGEGQLATYRCDRCSRSDIQDTTLAYLNITCKADSTVLVVTPRT